MTKDDGIGEKDFRF